MPISACNLAVDASGKELTIHGNSLFPIAIYEDDLALSPIDSHWHDEFEMGIITSGNVWLYADTEKKLLNTGDSFFIFPGVLHNMKAGNVGECTLKSSVFSSRLICGDDSIIYEKYIRDMEKGRKFRYIIFNADNYCDIVPLISKVWELCDVAAYGYEIMIRNIISEIILKLGQMPAAEALSAQFFSLKSIRIKDMLSFIQLHYYENIALKDIAGAANISESEALREFNLFTKTSPVSYLINYRIQSAAAMLSSNELSISEICSRCGFNDVSYFTKAFKSIKGMPPGKYRKQFN